MEILEEVVIVGGGIAGLATALALKTIGIRSLVLERSHELRVSGAALTLFPNAWRALNALGVDHKISSLYPPISKAKRASRNRETAFGQGPKKKKKKIFLCEVFWSGRKRAMMVEICKDVVIVGGGIAGLATAVALHRLSIGSLVLERCHELRTTGTSITLAPNAWRALDALGVAHKLHPLYDSISEGYFTDVATGKTGVVPLTEPGRSDSGPKLVHRSVLLGSLAEELPQNTIRFSAKLASINTETIDGSSTAVLHLEDGTVIKAKAVIGCDGVHSVVADWLGLSAPIESGRSGVRGLTIYPEGHGVKEVRQFLAPGARAGFAPLNATELYWFITYTGTESSRDPEVIKKLVMEYKAKGFPQSFMDAVEQTEVESLTLDKLRFRLPWNLIFRPAHRGNVTVAGDAMHPMTPDLGQGGCMALEDAVVLGRNISRLRQAADGSIDWGKIEEGLGAYVKERKWRVAAVIAGAYISGRAQQGETGWLAKFSWLTKFFRDYLFYGFIFNRFLEGVRNYDVGRLTEAETQAKPKLN